MTTLPSYKTNIFLNQVQDLKPHLRDNMISFKVSDLLRHHEQAFSHLIHPEERTVFRATNESSLAEPE